MSLHDTDNGELTTDENIQISWPKGELRLLVQGAILWVIYSRIYRVFASGEKRIEKAQLKQRLNCFDRLIVFGNQELLDRKSVV